MVNEIKIISSLFPVGKIFVKAERIPWENT